MLSTFLITLRDTNNPFVRVTCFDKTEKTRTLKKIGTTDAAIWGEHLFIEAKKLVKFYFTVDF